VSVDEVSFCPFTITSSLLRRFVFTASIGILIVSARARGDLYGFRFSLLSYLIDCFEHWCALFYVFGRLSAFFVWYQLGVLA